MVELSAVALVNILCAVQKFIDDFELDLQKTSGKHVRTIAIVVGNTGALHKHTAENVELLKCGLDVARLQKTAAIETVKRALSLIGCRR